MMDRKDRERPIRSFNEYWADRRNTCKVWDQNSEEGKHLVTWFQSRMADIEYHDAPDLVRKLLEAVEVLKEIAGLELTAANVAKEFLRGLE